MSTNSTLLPRQISLKQAAELYGIPVWTLRSHVYKRTIPFRHVGRRIYLPVEKFEAWLSKGDVEPIENTEVEK